MLGLIIHRETAYVGWIPTCQAADRIATYLSTGVPPDFDLEEMRNRSMAH